MNLSYINYFYDNDVDIENYFIRYPSVSGWCDALSEKGISVTVYQRFDKDLILSKGNVIYKFINDRLGGNLNGRQIPYKFHNQIIADKPDIIHINSFNYIFQACLLKIKSKKSKIIIQHHAEKYKHGWKKILTKHLSKNIDGFIFSSKEIYDDWINSRSLTPNKTFGEILENSTEFSSGSKAAAKRISGMNGNPNFLWVGRLNENKDPLTILKGFKKLLELKKDAKLYMIFSENDLETKIKRIISNDNQLSHSIKLLGKIDHSNIIHYYNSADFFVLGSHYEGSGYSLIEAIACGVFPIVTNIPSFRTITKNGAVGSLWEPGNENSFFNAILKTISQDPEDYKLKAKEIFSNNLSFNAISNNAVLFYSKVLNTQF